MAKAPVPPCIMAVDGNTTQISLEVDDRSAHATHQINSLWRTQVLRIAWAIRGFIPMLCTALWLDLQALR